MNILLILGHPKPKSLNHAIAQTSVSALQEWGHEVLVRDLYQERFDPVMPADENILPDEHLPTYLQEYIRHFKEAEGMIIVHPNWWGGPPAILRGWVDRVVRQGSCYSFTKDGVVSHVGGKIVQVFSTSNTPRDVEINVYGDPIEVFWKTVVFGPLGTKSFERRNFESVVMSTPEMRKEWLEEVETTLKRRFGRG
jgi:putative NADPH-quinone reductase